MRLAPVVACLCVLASAALADPKHKQLVKIVQPDKKGHYIIALEPGEYTIVAEINGKLYLNSFSGKGFWSTVTINANEWKVFNIADSSEATF